MPPLCAIPRLRLRCACAEGGGSGTGRARARLCASPCATLSRIGLFLGVSPPAVVACAHLPPSLPRSRRLPPLPSTTELASDGLKGRVVEVSLADLTSDVEHSFRKIKLSLEDVQGRNCLTNFHGMDLTTDKLRSLVRKWHSLIEAHVDVRTTDGYHLRVFVIGFTQRRSNQVKKTTYAQTSQILAIRKKMFEILNKEVSTVDLKELVAKLIAESIGKTIEKECKVIYPLHNVFLRKVKVLRKPKFDASKLMELHADNLADDTGAPVSSGFVEPVPSDNI